MKKSIVLMITIVLSLLFFNLIANAEKDITLSVEKGSFILKNISTIPEGDALRLKCDVVNKTYGDWEDVLFDFDVYYSVKGESKELKKAFIIMISDIKKDETKSISSSYHLEKDAVFSRYEISFNTGFNTGRYTAIYSFSMIKPEESKKLFFEDSFLKILFSISTEISFALYNKTSNPIKVDWNYVSYIDIFAKSHKVVHSGIRYLDKGKPQAPTMVPPTARLEEVVFPIDYVYYDGGWRKKPLLPQEATIAIAKLLKGKSFSIFMPLEVNGATKNYLFTFKINGVD